MGKKIVRRYELIVENTETSEIISIDFKEEDGRKYPKTWLANIDKATMKFVNEDHLLDYLKEQGKINFSSAKVAIRYYYTNPQDKKSREENSNDKKDEKRLNVIYKNDSELNKLCRIIGSNIDIGNETFKNLFSSFISEINNGITYRNIIGERTLNGELDESLFINKRLKQLIESYVYCRDEADKDGFKKQLMEEFSRYKVIRGYLLMKGIKQDYPYIKPKEETEDIHLGFPPGSKELEDLKNYLEKLPDEGEHPHKNDNQTIGKIKRKALPPYKNQLEGQTSLYE